MTARLPPLTAYRLLGAVYAHQLPTGVWRVLHGDESATAVYVPDATFQRLYGPYNADTGHPGGEGPERNYTTEPGPGGNQELAVGLLLGVSPPALDPKPFSATITIPTTPSSDMRPNAVGKTGRGAAIKFNTEKKRLRGVASLSVSSYLNGIDRPWPLFPDNARIDVAVFWEKVRSPRYPNGRYRTPVDDHDALPLMCKPLVDGLVDGGILDDDRHLRATYAQSTDPEGLGCVLITLTMPEDHHP